MNCETADYKRYYKKVFLYCLTTKKKDFLQGKL